MMKSTMRSQERILATLRRQPVDHLPLCVDGICHGYVRHVSERLTDPLVRARYYLDLGLDTAIQVACPSFASEGIVIREWREEPSAGEPHPVLHKAYVTSAGTLTQVVRKTPDYPADTIHLICDHNVPASRSKTYLVSTEEHLDALARLLSPAARPERDRFAAEMRQYRTFCDEQGILLSVYAWGVADAMVWFSGIEPLLLMALDRPDVFQRYVEIVAEWNRRLIALAIECGADWVVRRGWYESTDFWSPQLFSQFLLEPLRQDVELCHAAGVPLAYVMASGAGPLLPFFREAGLDVYSNIDPDAPGTDLRTLKTAAGGHFTLCGGLNNYHVLEQGTEDEVRQAVRRAIDTLAPGGGFILAPADTVNVVSATCERNFETLVATWKEMA